jgi:hypothetical protein
MEVLGLVLLQGSLMYQACGEVAIRGHDLRAGLAIDEDIQMADIIMVQPGP